MMRERLLGIPLDIAEKDAYVSCIRDMLKQHEGNTIVTLTSEMVVDAQSDRTFRNALEQAACIIPDTVGIVYAMQILKKKHITRYPGVDLFQDLLRMANEQSLRVLLLGGDAQTQSAFLDRYHALFPALYVRAIDPGLIDEKDPHLSSPLQERLKREKYDVLCVALGQGRGKRQGKQEKIMQQLRDLCPHVRIVIGIGGTLDYLAGNVARAPKWFQEKGLEWLYRLVRQPWRLQRVFKAVIVLSFLTVKEYFLQKIKRTSEKE